MAVIGSDFRILCTKVVAYVPDQHYNETMKSSTEKAGFLNLRPGTDSKAGDESQKLLQAQSHFLYQSDTDLALTKSFEDLCLSFDLDRVYVFSNSQHPYTSELVFSQKYKWVRDKSIFEKRNLEVRDIPYGPYYSRWRQEMEKNQSIWGRTENFPEIEQELLEGHSVKSVLLVPYFNQGSFAGFFEFDRCNTDTVFTQSERDHLAYFSRFCQRFLENEEIKQHQQEEIQLLNKSLDSKNEVLSNISHELRTPMNGIVGLAEQLDNLEDDSSKKSYLESIRLSASNLMVVLHDILDYSSLDSEDTELEEYPVNIGEKINPCSAAFCEKAEEKGLKFSFSMDESIPKYVIVDAKRVSQIFNNLADNAIKFTHEGGITAKVGWQKNSSEAFLIFTMEDTGIGIAKDKLEYIFERFTQIDSGTTRNYGGIGLGLAIVRKLVRMMQGTITVSSAENEGSSFTVRIPVQLPDTEDLRTDENSVILLNLKILVVDDHPINRKVATAILKKWGADFDVACDGAEAVEMCKAENYDLILMDIQMPVMDGYTATRFIRQEKGDEITILALTASILKEDENKCIDAGMNGIIRKPFFPDNLRKWIYTRKLKTDFEMDDLTEHPDESTDSVTNMNYLESIADGNREFIDEMVNMFVDQIDDHLDALNEGVNKENYADIAAAAHKVKPVLGYVGIDLERASIREIEHMAKTSAPLSEISQKILKLSELIELAKVELQNYLSAS